MKRKFQSITSRLWSAAALVVIIVIWQVAASAGLVPGYMLPSPVEVVQALISDFPLLMEHAKVTLAEAFLGLFYGVVLGFVMAVIMDRFDRLYQALYPLIVVTQTIPTVAIAPLLVLWLGYEMLPKVILIVIVTFFPVTVGLLNGFRSADRDMINLLRSMGAGRVQIFRYIKLPGAMGQFFSSLRISASYSLTTTSSGGLLLPLQRGIVTAHPTGWCRKHFYWSAYKAVLLESSFLDSSACSLIYFCTASSVILPIVST